jgi:hypothetical protein
VTGIPRHQVHELWGQVKPLIEAALSRGRGEMLAEDVLGFLVSGDMQLWIARDDRIRAICVTEIVQFPRLKVCRLALGAGSGLRLWSHGKAVIKSWAQSQGCNELWGGGRKGWSRVLGWKPIYFICAEKCDA